MIERSILHDSVILLCLKLICKQRIDSKHMKLGLKNENTLINNTIKHANDLLESFGHATCSLCDAEITMRKYQIFKNYYRFLSHYQNHFLQTKIYGNRMQNRHDSSTETQLGTQPEDLEEKLKGLNVMILALQMLSHMS